MGIHILKILRLFRVVSIIAILLPPSVLRAQTASQDEASFLPYLSCSFDDGLKIVEVLRLPKSAKKFRELDTRNGKKKVTRIDGYTVEFAYHKTDVFVNLKVEQSIPQSYPQDKEVIMEELKWLLPRAKAVDQKELRRVTVKGVDVYGYDRNILGLGIVMGQYVFFEDNTNKIITIYFLNQKSNRLKPQTIEEYRVLRDKFLSNYVHCVANNQ